MPAFAGMTIALITKEYQPALSCLEFVSVILDDGVGEELLAHVLYFGAGARRIALGHLDLDIFTLAHIANRAEAERMERAGDRLALRVEHPRLQRDGDARLHAPVFRLRPIWSAPALGPCVPGADCRHAARACAPPPDKPRPGRPCRGGSGPCRACSASRRPTAGSNRARSRQPARCASARCPTACRTRI